MGNARNSDSSQAESQKQRNLFFFSIVDAAPKMKNTNSSNLYSPLCLPFEIANPRQPPPHTAYRTDVFVLCRRLLLQLVKRHASERDREYSTTKRECLISKINTNQQQLSKQLSCQMVADCGRLSLDHVEAAGRALHCR